RIGKLCCMKKSLIFIFITILSAKCFAQTPDDAIRFSWFPQNGSARNMAVGGVMGSLGGDITAAFVNPAGLGFYRTNEAVMTAGFSFSNIKANFRQAET